MERAIRIGKDFNVRWSIRKVMDGERQPYELAGKELVLQYRRPNGTLHEAKEWRVDGNIIIWTFRGRDQKAPGLYDLILTENGGKDGMVTVDTCKAFKLVEHSCEETEGSGNDIVIEDVVLESEVAFAPVVIEGGGGGSYDDTEIKEDIADLQAKDAEQSAKLAELSAEVDGLTKGAESTYTRLATGTPSALSPHIISGQIITSISGINSLSLYDEEDNKFTITQSMLPYSVAKTFVKWVAYATGSPTIEMKVVSQARLSQIEDSIEDIKRSLEDVDSAENIDITLPNTILAIVGDTMQIYWRSILSAVNPYIFDIYAVSSVGKSFPRYYEFKPTADMVGKSYNLDVYVKTNDGTIVAHKTATIKVAATMESPSSTKNILCIGASATAGGQWVGELNRRLTATNGDGTPSNPTGLGLSNIAFVGRKVGTANAIHLEATGGWTVKDYATKGARAIRFYVSGVDTISLGARYSCNGTTYVVQEVNVTEGVGNIRCTLESAFVVPSGKLTKLTGSGDAEITFTSYEDENFSPFWNASESRIDFQQYADTYCDGHIDCLIWHCGVNDITSGDPSVIPPIIDAFRNILTAYHEQFPNGKVIISSVPIGSVNGGFAANYGANRSLNYYTFAKIAQLYAQALIELTNEEEYKEFATYSPVLEQFDAENNYPVKEVAVNNRSSVKEKQGTNAVHPIAEGSYQVADAIYRTINTLDMNVGEPEQIEPYDSMSGVYLAKGGSVVATSSPRSVATFPIEEGKKYELYVPKTGNDYAAVYSFGNNGEVATGYINTTTGVGNEQPQTLTFVAPSYKYVYVCYTNDSGVPTLTRL